MTSPADLWRDQPIIDAIDHWSAGEAPDSLTLAKLISEHIRAVGKHFLSVPILTRLTEIRREHGTRDPFLDAFLDGILVSRGSRKFVLRRRHYGHGAVASRSRLHTDAL